MEARITQIEKDLAVMGETQKSMSKSLESIAQTLEKMSGVQTVTKLLEERIGHMDTDLRESFARVHKRIDEEANVRKWATRVVVGFVLITIMSVTLKGNT